MNIKSKINPLSVGAVFFVLLLIGIGFWYWQKKPSGVSIAIPTSVDQKTADVSLGSQILLRTQNIVEDKFPETNPLKRIIKNPF